MKRINDGVVPTLPSPAAVGYIYNIAYNMGFEAVELVCSGLSLWQEVWEPPRGKRKG